MRFVGERPQQGRQDMIGWALRQLAIWGGAGLLFYAVLGDRLSLPSHPAGGAQAPASAAHAAMPNALTFRANPQGHVIVDGAVNGAPVRFLVDTGASVVALTLQDAAAAGISRNDLNYTLAFRTANGVARAAPVTLRELRIGQLVIPDVQAVVQENLFSSLLGQTFLTRVDSYEMRDGVLTINYW
ncbi:MAG: TIGR02281 family clan AA aspartic protease [Thiohalocapsa sp.]